MKLSKSQRDRVKMYILKRFNLMKLIEGYGLQTYPDTDNRVKMKCPFHNEKTASFVVYVDQNKFHCFGCAETGNVINFMMLKEGKTYQAVIEDFSENVDIHSNKFFAETLINSVNRDSFNLKNYSKDTEYELSVFLRDASKKNSDKIPEVDSCFRDMDMFFSNPDNIDEERVKKFSDTIIDRAS